MAGEANQSGAYQGWAIVELMGHRSLVGEISEAEAFGCKLLRIDAPVSGADENLEPRKTQFYGGAAIYCITPTTEDYVRRLVRPKPVAALSHFDASDEDALGDRF
jgi:hypothetical protein